MSGGLQRLANKVCIVTGAASTLAEVVADRLASDGAIVVGVDRHAHGTCAHARQADLAEEDQVRELFAQAKNLGRIDVLYNNVGLNDRDDHSALDMPLPVWGESPRCQSHRHVPVLQARHPVPAGQRSAEGSVINTASFLAGMSAASSQLAYSVAEAGVLQLSRDLRVHLGRRVRVNALVLGPHRNPSAGRTLHRHRR